MLILDVDGTLTDGGVYIDVNGVQSKKFNIKDGMGIRMIQEQGIIVGIISHSRANTILEARARMLFMDPRYVYSGNEPKLTILEGWLNELGITYDQVAYIGDDFNDVEILTRVGLSACPRDAHDSVLGKVDVILKKKGGKGCVREFIDRFLLHPMV